MFHVAPFGERRMDLRMAFNTAHMMAMQSAKTIEAREFSELVKSLSSYLACDNPNDDEVDMTALKTMQRADNGE